MAVPLILDVDTGIDDALALLYACASPEAELLAVTCSAGNTDVRQVAANTLGVLGLAGCADVPVHLGSERPLRKQLVTTPETHGPTGTGYAELPAPTLELAGTDAAHAIVDLARSRPGEVVLVTLGPLTNLAHALEREPALPSLLGGWVLMGGAYRSPGNTTPTSEWNMHVDPDAAKACFAAWREAGDAATAEAATAGSATTTGGGPDRRPLPLAMGLDVTERARFRPEHLRHLAVRADVQPLDANALGAEPLEAIGSVAANPILRFLADSLRFYFEFHARYDGFYGAFIHDAFAVAVALDRSLVRAEPVFVDVEAGANLAHAMTVADWRHLTPNPPNLDVAVEADAETFIERLIERVGGLAGRRAAVAR